MYMVSACSCVTKILCTSLKRATISSPIILTLLSTCSIRCNNSADYFLHASWWSSGMLMETCSSSSSLFGWARWMKILSRLVSRNGCISLMSRNTVSIDLHSEAERRSSMVQSSKVLKWEMISWTKPSMVSLRREDEDAWWRRGNHFSLMVSDHSCGFLLEKMVEDIVGRRFSWSFLCLFLKAEKKNRQFFLV